MKRITSSVVILLFLLSISTVRGLDQKTVTISSRGTVVNPASNPRTEETIFNGIWTWKKYVNSEMLREMVSHKIFNIFVNVGYPNAEFDSRLTGIVPEHEIGITITPEKVTELNQLLASVDSRLKLWAWVGTWSYDPRAYDDHTGHYYAKVDLSTSYNRQLIIENIVKVAGWGFYGVQDDTEDVVQTSTLVQKYQDQVNFWNEEKAALNQIGVKLATFTYAGPPSLWTYNSPYEFIKQLKVDYIILSADNRQSQEVIDDYGPIEEIWKYEIEAGLSSAQSPIVINTPSADGSGVEELPLDVMLDLQSEINPTSHPNYAGNAIYCYRNEGMSITNNEWIAWDNYLLTLGEEGK